MTLWRPWPAVRTVALLGVQGLYWLWFASAFQPEKRPAAFLFIAVIYALFFGHALLTARRRAGRRRPGPGRAEPGAVFRRRLLPARRQLSLVEWALAPGRLACACGAAFVVRWRADDLRCGYFGSLSA